MFIKEEVKTEEDLETLDLGKEFTIVNAKG